MKTVCPQCKQKYEIDNAYNGFEIQCPYCETNFIVQKICAACDGLGVKYTDDSHKEICKNCDGTGIIVPKKRKRRDGTVKNKITQPSNTSVHDCVKLPDCSTPVKLKISQNISVEDYVKWSKKQKNAVKVDDLIVDSSKNKKKAIASELATQNNNSLVTHSSNSAKQKTCWRCDGLGRKYTNGGNGEVCHVCNGFGVIHESSDSLYKNPPRHSNPSSDFDSPIVKGCGFILALILLCVIGGLCGNKNDRKTTANSGIPTEEELMYPMDGKDPKNWRKCEEDLENRLPHLKNAPYACKRCGMKSDRPLDDPQGVWGRNGVCAYCIDYLHSKR
jgi:DNA-directed RNA polymerase subunit RPC12/RpoP